MVWINPRSQTVGVHRGCGVPPRSRQRLHPGLFRVHDADLHLPCRLEGHYQWVIFLVVMVVAIVGIWVGACVWRRRYLRKKDRMYALGTNQARATESGRIVPNGSSAGSVHAPAAGMFDPAPITSAGVYGEKPKTKKWALRNRD